jgi:hypothetical protein
MWKKVQENPSVVAVAFVAAATYVNTQTGIPGWLTIVTGAIVAAGTAIKLRAAVTPVNK